MGVCASVSLCVCVCVCVFCRQPACLAACLWAARAYVPSSSPYTIPYTCVHGHLAQGSSSPYPTRLITLPYTFVNRPQSQGATRSAGVGAQTLHSKPKRVCTDTYHKAPPEARVQQRTCVPQPFAAAQHTSSCTVCAPLYVCMYNTHTHTHTHTGKYSHIHMYVYTYIYTSL